MHRVRPAVLATMIATVLSGAGITADATTEPPESTVVAGASDESTAGTSIATAAAVAAAPDLADIELSATGLGVAAFGDDADSTLATMVRYLGDPTADTQWVDPVALGVCSGAAARLVSWGALQLYFISDDPVDVVVTVETTGTVDSSVPTGSEPVPVTGDSSVPTGSEPVPVTGDSSVPTGSEPVPATGDSSGVERGGPRLVGFAYGDESALDANPPGLSTPEGIGLGALVEFLEAAYPNVIVEPGIEGIAAATFFVDAGLRGYVTGVEADDLVTVIIGGEVCDS